jgi:hypothetical protein
MRREHLLKRLFEKERLILTSFKIAVGCFETIINLLNFLKLLPTAITRI